MIAIAPTVSPGHVSEQTKQSFLDMAPQIRKVAEFAFRKQPSWRREQLVFDVLAKSYVAYVRLVQRGKEMLAYPTVLARFSIKQVNDNRQVGARQNCKDVLSPHAQRRKGFVVESLHYSGLGGRWEELVVEDKRATPAAIAACRLDFRAWLRQLKQLQRAVALCLCTGNTTSEAARHFGLSRSRISQLRQELREDWHTFDEVPVLP